MSSYLQAPPGSPQPMTLLDYSTVKVINMPSLAQGQFRESPLQIFRSSNSSVSRSRECYHSESGAKIKRKIKSLTECKFMPSNISLSHKPDTLIWASSDPKKSYFRCLIEYNNLYFTKQDPWIEVHDSHFMYYPPPPPPPPMVIGLRVQWNL